MPRTAIEADGAINLAYYCNLSRSIGIVEGIVLVIVYDLRFVAANLAEEVALPLFSAAVARDHGASPS